MKHPFTLKAFGFASLLTATSAFAQVEPAPVAGSVSNLTLNLTISSSIDGTVKKDPLTGKPLTGDAAGPASGNSWETTNAKGVTTETTERVTKIVNSKYSTKEFLLDLVEEEVIDDIKGWTVKKVQATFSDEGLSLSDAFFFLQSKEGEIIFLGNTLSFESDSIAKGESFKEVITSTEEEGITSTKTTYTEALKFAGELEINLDGEDFELRGVLTSSQKLAFTKAKDPVIVSGAAKISSLSGFRAAGEIVEGSAAISAGVLSADVSAFLAEIPQ